MSLEQRIRKFIEDMRKVTSAVVPAVIANDLQEIVDAAGVTAVLPIGGSDDIRTAIGADLDRLVGAMFRGAMTDHAFRQWAHSDGQPVAWEFRDNSWQEGMWASITKSQYEGYLGPDVVGRRDTWQVRPLFDRPTFARNCMPVFQLFNDRSGHWEDVAKEEFDRDRLNRRGARVLFAQQQEA